MLFARPAARNGASRLRRTSNDSPRPRTRRPRAVSDLADRGIATREQVDTSQAGATALNATVEADRAAVENAKVQLQYATIAAPLSGRTGALMVHEGNLVRANDTIPLVTINQVTPINVSFAIPESRLPELKRYMAKRTLQVTASVPNEDAVRRSAASASSTTTSIRRPARSGSRGRSPMPIAGSGPVSSSTSRWG